MYPERDLNPHNRNGHRILSPACLPFHHPGGLEYLADIKSIQQLIKNSAYRLGWWNSTPAAWLLAKNTHRVFSLRSPLPSGQLLSCSLAALQVVPVFRSG